MLIEYLDDTKLGQVANILDLKSQNISFNKWGL